MKTLLMNAEDDPFLPAETLERVRAIAAGNGNRHVLFTKLGGHVGWVREPPWSPQYPWKSVSCDSWPKDDDGTIAVPVASP